MKSSQTLRDLAELLETGKPLPVTSDNGKHLALVWLEESFHKEHLEERTYLLDYCVQIGKHTPKNVNQPISFYPINITRPLQPQLEELCAHVRDSFPYINNNLPPDSYSNASSISTPDNELEWFDS